MLNLKFCIENQWSTGAIVQNLEYDTSLYKAREEEERWIGGV